MLPHAHKEALLCAWEAPRYCDRHCLPHVFLCPSQVKLDDSECVSASSDGSCIIWDLHTFKRRTSLFANTFFKSVIYHPDESQLVTTGTDRKVRAWGGCLFFCAFKYCLFHSPKWN